MQPSRPCVWYEMMVATHAADANAAPTDAHENAQTLGLATFVVLLLLVLVVLESRRVRRSALASEELSLAAAPRKAKGFGFPPLSLSCCI